MSIFYHPRLRWLRQLPLDIPRLRSGNAQVVSRRSEPGGERVREPRVGSVSYPHHMSVGPNQHGSGSTDRAKYRKLPRTAIVRVAHLNPIRPWRDVEAAGLTEIEEH